MLITAPCLTGEESRCRVQLHDEVEEFFVHFCERLARNQTACIVDENVDLIAKGCGCGCEQSGDIRWLGHVGFHLDALATGGFDRSDRCIGVCFIVVVIDDDACAFAGELNAHGAANVAATAGYNCHFACKFHFIVPL